jgi:hypothetical protein
VAKSIINLRHGFERDPKTRHHEYGAQPNARQLLAMPGETLGSITLRAYGANTANYRQKILSANASLNGAINVPL